MIKKLLGFSAISFCQNFTLFGVMMYLVLHLTQTLHYSTSMSFFIFSLFTAMMTLTPIIGGWLADRYLSQKMTIHTGQLLMIAGGFLLLFTQTYFAGLALVALGSGYVRPCVTALIGQISTAENRTKYFSFYYAFLNLGAFIGAVVFGSLSQNSQSVAVPLIVIGVIFAGFLIALKCVTHQPHAGSNTRAFWVSFVTTLAITVLSIVGYYAPSQLAPLPLVIFVITTILFLLYRQKHPGLIKHMWLAAASVPFFIMSFQVGELMTTFVEHHVDRHVLGFNIPTLYFSSLDALFILFWAPIFVYVWSRPCFKNWSVLLKTALGLCIAALCFYLLHTVSHMPHHAVMVLPLVFLSYVLISGGEVTFFPSLLSALSDVDTTLKNRIMGYLYLSISAGVYLSALVGNLVNKYAPHAPFETLSIIALCAAGVYGVVCLRK